MPKAYWIACYREISQPDKLAAYAKLALPAIEAGGGRILARGTAAQAYEAGVRERTVLIEFDSVDQAIAVHDSAAYRAALAALRGGAVRDLRIVRGRLKAPGCSYRCASIAGRLRHVGINTWSGRMLDDLIARQHVRGD
jgi:uncharacterized protein (DUF1330 family)